MRLPKLENAGFAGVLLLGVAGLVMLLRLRDMGLVYEDAAILMRYAENLASGHGIVWNEGAPAADGATDFLFMMVVAALRAMGLGIETAVRLPAIIAQFCTIALVYWGNRRLGSGRFWPVLAGLTLAAGPATAYIAAGFGAPFFAFFACMLLYLILRFEQVGRSAYAWAAGFCALLLGLTRPEGVILAALLALAWVPGHPWKQVRRLLIPVGVCLFGIGGLYFIWRWSYFGQPFPTPFLKKGGFALHLDGLKDSLIQVYRFLIPWVALILVYPGRTVIIRWWGLAVGAFALMWVLLSPEMNYLGRFQYPIFSGTAMLLPLLVKKGSLRPWQQAGLLLLSVGYFGVVFRGEVRFQDGRYDVAKAMRAYTAVNPVLLTTEAGLLPLYSSWSSIDAWGLNDPDIARNGLDTAALGANPPDLIMFHAYFSPKAPESVCANPQWAALVRTLQAYAQSHGYIRAAVWGVSPQESHYYYVQPGFEFARALVRDIQTVPYHWFESGRRCHRLDL